MKNLSRECSICGLHNCKADYFICLDCINGNIAKRKFQKAIWQAPNTMEFIENKFIENIDSLSEENKSELLKLLAKNKAV